MIAMTTTGLLGYFWYFYV